MYLWQLSKIIYHLLNVSLSKKGKIFCCPIFFDKQFTLPFSAMLFFFWFSLIFFKVDHTLTDSNVRRSACSIKPDTVDLDKAPE